MSFTASYRPEIDALRAIAVTSVIAFHFFPTFLPYGFLGVDLFFVISGFVITQLIYSQTRSGQFSLTDFYQRRIKRILPLTFTVLVATVLAGRILLLPSDFSRLGQSAFASATFWSNIYFWRDGGYFGGANELKPLLHLWSLSVEEQFYVFYPIILLLIIWKYQFLPSAIAFTLFLLSIVSFAAYVYLIWIGGDGAAFFLTPARSWQFGLGGLAALAVAEGWATPKPWIAGAAFVMLVLCFVINISPLFQSAILTFCTAMFLATSSGIGLATRLLSVAPLQWIGLRSFSLYLWHWPIVAYLHYAFVDLMALRTSLIALAVCILLSSVSYTLIENPFRRVYSTEASLFLIFAGSLGILLLFIGAKPNGTGSTFPQRLAQQSQTNFRCAAEDFVSYGSSRACVLKTLSESSNTAILGNSHAQMYAPLIADAYKDKDIGLILVPLNGCMPTTSLNVNVRCAELANGNLEAVKRDKRISRVIIGSTYPTQTLIRRDGILIMEDSAQAEIGTAFVDLIDNLEAAGKQVWLIGPILTPGYDLPSELSRKIHFGYLTEHDGLRALSVSRTQFDRMYDLLVNRLRAKIGNHLILPERYFCDHTFCQFGDESGSFFADGTHLSQYGIRHVSEAFSYFLTHN